MKYVRLLVVVLVSGVLCADEALNKAGLDIEARVSSALEAQLEPENQDIEKQIAVQVDKQINKQLFAELKSYTKKDVYGNRTAKYPELQPKGPTFIYKLPTWPRQAQFFAKKDLIGVDFTAQFASQAYGSSGGTKNVSQLMFQEKPIRVKDILLASKLIDIGVGLPTSSKYNFLSILRNQTLDFDMSVDRQELDFSYVRHFLGGDIALGIEVPLVRKFQRIRFKSSLTPQLNEQLSSQSAGFFSTYPNGLKDLFKDILSKKNIQFNERDTETGLGDILLFAHYEVPTKHCERFVVGARALFPTSHRRDIYKLCDPELGNGGFTELSLFSGLLFGESRWFNPHCFVQATCCLSESMFRRVPKTVSKSDIENITLAMQRFGSDFMLYGNGVKYVSTQPDFSELDSTVRYFADTAKKTKIHCGGNIWLRIGNIFEHVFTEGLFFDLFYDFYAKGRDYIGGRRAGDEYDPSLLTKNTYEINHRLGLDLSWQVDNSWRFYVGGLYVFAGRNTLRNLEINAGINFQF